jgi:ATP/maltotriose-dependent transcriptional regulator MalT/DNA-binding SARP family transcriptional activator
MTVAALEASILRRPRLESRLDEALARRLTLLVADAGFGKSTLLTAWAGRHDVAWHTFAPEERSLAAAAAAVAGALERELSFQSGEDDPARVGAVASELCRDVGERLDRDLALVLDDVHELGARTAGAQLVEALVRQAPPRFHLVLSSRTEPSFGTQRLRGQGQVVELTAADLAFDVDEVDALLALTLEEETQLAAAVHELTGGWPAAVRLTVEALRTAKARDRPAAIERLRRSDGPLFAYLAEEVFGRGGRGLRELVATVAPLDRFTVDLCEALGIPRAADTVAALERRGLLVRREDEAFVLHGLVREFALSSLQPDAGHRGEVLRRAAGWLEERGRVAEALSAAVAAGEATHVRRLLERHGDELMGGGAVEAVREAAEALPPPTRGAVVEQILGEAYVHHGRWDDAAAALARAAGKDDLLRAKLAGLLGLAEWERGRPDAALAAFQRGRLDGSKIRDEALLLAWMARPFWNLGRLDEARSLVDRALAAATAAGDPAALAAAHGAAVQTSLGGDPQLIDDHLRLAIEAAEAAGDTMTAVRMRLNRTHRLGPREALPEIETALRLAELAGAGPNLAYAFHRRGEAKYYVGRLDDAALDFEQARTLNEQLGSSRSSWDLMYLGDIARERGDLARARTAYEQGLRVAKAGRDAQGMRGSQAGLALVLAHEQPDRARELAAEAVAVGRSVGHDVAAALNAAGWIALLTGETHAAAEYAREAREEATAQDFAPHVAEAVELAAMAAPDPAALEEAAAIWRSIGNDLAVARLDLAVGRRTGDRAAAARATRRLRAAGVRDSAAAAAGLLACLPRETPVPVAIRTLGGFAVLRDGVPVALSEWRSRKARDLLKILIGRRGRPVPRDVLLETLWPGEDPVRVGRRLSVALSILRSVLDPGKQFEPDRLVVSERSALSLRRHSLVVDVDDFLDEARAGLAGDPDRLLAAEEAYTGDFLEEDVYEDWSVGLREEARIAYIDVARVLARDAAADGRADDAVRYLLRLLERDPFDEQAHLELVRVLEAAGRHGEARRSYRAYEVRMAEIDVEPATYPAGPRS